MVSSWEWKHIKIWNQLQWPLHTTEGHKSLTKEQTSVESRIAWMLDASLLPQLTKAPSIIQRGLDKLMGVGEASLSTVMCLELAFRTSLNSGNYWVVNNWRLEMHSWWISLLVSPIVKPPRASAFKYHWSWASMPLWTRPQSWSCLFREVSCRGKNQF